jgi:hypothetical protein
MAHEVIAIALGLSRNTLRKHFAQELCAGAAARRMEVVNAQYRAAVRGNVAAQKAFLQGQAIGKKSPRESKVGKKERAQRAALTAEVGTEWEELLQKPV